LPKGSLSNKRRDVSKLDEATAIVNLRFTYKNVPITLLDKLSFKEPHDVLKEVCGLDYVNECLILQTCNRVEVYLATSGRRLNEAATEVAEFWRQRNNLEKDEFYRYLEGSFNSEALTHLLRLTSGLESMIVGEDQILSQVQRAFEEATECNTISQVLKTTFEKAIKKGRKIRLETKINKGAVSVGSAAIKLLEEEMGSLKDKKVLIIGAGELGSLMGKSLALREKAAILVANRSREKGVKLARMLGGCDVPFNKVEDVLTDVDVAIVATAAPHYVLTEKMVQEVSERRGGRRLLIVDLSQPRNVEESAARLPNVEVRNIDDLRGIAEINLETRREEIAKAEAIVESELGRLESMLKRERAEPVISSLCENLKRSDVKK